MYSYVHTFVPRLFYVILCTEYVRGTTYELITGVGGGGLGLL